VSIQTFSNMCR